MIYILAGSEETINKTVNFEKLNPDDFPEGKEDFTYCIYREYNQEIKAALDIDMSVFAVISKTGTAHCIEKSDEGFLFIEESRHHHIRHTQGVWLRGDIEAIQQFKHIRGDVYDDYVVNKPDPRIKLWPVYFGHLTKRWTGIINNRYCNFDIKKSIPCFIKTIDKHESQVLLSEDDIDFSTINITEGKSFIISEIMTILDNPISGKEEIRVSVINGKIAGVSYYLDYVILPIKQEAKYFAQWIVDITTKEGLLNFVVDICETDEGFEIVEFNDIDASGRYAGIKAEDVIKCILEYS